MPKHVVDVDKLYTPGNIVVLWLLCVYPYRIITLDSHLNKSFTSLLHSRLNSFIDVHVPEGLQYTAH